MTANTVFSQSEIETIARLELDYTTSAQRKQLSKIFPQYKSVIVKFDTVAEERAKAALAEAQAKAAQYAAQTHFDLEWNGETISVPLGLLEYIGMSKASLDGNNDYNNTAQFPLLAAFKHSVDKTLELVHLGKGYSKEAAYAQQTRERIEASL
jgi:hypothetical protein